MTDFQYYSPGYGEGPYLQLHDHHTLWQIDNLELIGLDDVIWLSITSQLQRLESSYKNLTVYALGRSGRHICIDDTPINRRRYTAIQNKCFELEEELIQYLNNYKA